MERTCRFHTREILGDLQTPVAAYWKLAHDQEHSFLLESVTGGEQLARYSIIGIRPRAVVRSKHSRCTVTRAGTVDDCSLPQGTDPLSIVKELLGNNTDAQPGMPKFAGGAVGIIGYDFIRFIERLPEETEDDLKFDDVAMMLADTVVVFDHAKQVIRIVVRDDGTPAGAEAAEEEMEFIAARLVAPLPELPGSTAGSGAPQYPSGRTVHCNMRKDEYEEGVRKIIDYISAGDCIQVVLSQRFEREVDAHPLTIYRALRSLNPSPYMFLMRFGDFDVIGASPEILVSLDAGQARVRPIAGTRWRGKDAEEDHALAEELLADEKERAEHIMLVDLGRNDLGRVCEYGSVKVNDLMQIERYSHVMHIVSDVTGTLAQGKDAYDLIRATFPAGTVSGAPKVRAMEIIEELEPTRRGLYAGAAGYISHSGDMDMCIAIRTILLKDRKAYVQAGAGIVYDSVPDKEHEECGNKAKACLRALDIAEAGLEG
ncbi:MAG TPA: anthranilate synthase component I [Fimbriimonadaceae bacterium]|nr:anthranilate synthase component I [Fimbriimonadaceae bacterium]